MSNPLLSSVIVVSLAVPTAWADEKPALKEVARIETFNALRLHALSSDGSKLAFTEWGGGKCELVLLDLATGKELRRGAPRQGWDGMHDKGVFSPDGKRLALSLSSRPRGVQGATWRDEVVVWDVERWKEVQTLQAPEGWSLPEPMVFSPDGKTLVGKCRRTPPRDFDLFVLLLWNLSTGKVRALEEQEKLAIKPDRRFNPSPGGIQFQSKGAVNPRMEPGAVVFADDGSDLLFVQYGGGTSVFNIAKDRTLFNVRLFWQTQPWPGTANDRFRYRLTPTGRFLPLPRYERPPLAACSDRAGVIRLLTLNKGEDFGHYHGTPLQLPFHEHCRIDTFRQQQPTTTVVLSGDGKRLVAMGNLPGEQGKHVLWVGDVSAFLADGQRLSAALPVEERERLWARLFEPHPDPDKSDHPGPEKARFQQFRAHGAMISLAHHPREAVAYLRKGLGLPVDLNSAVGWVGNLDSGDFNVRVKAERELEKLSHAAQPLMVKALAAQPSAEARKRIERLLDRLEGTEAAYELRVFRVVDVLEHLGTPEARKLLKDLVDGSHGAIFTEAAKAALQRQER